jgi:hypothetical protein
LSLVEELRLDRPFLERLTTAELIKLADRAGIDVPFGLERIVIIEELLEAMDDARTGAEKTAPFPLEERRQPASTAPLPRHYNISYVNVLVRDPLWAFAFWEVNAHDKELHEKAPDFGGYCLRVESDPFLDDSQAQGAENSSFTVQVGIGDSAWYLGFSPSGGTFKVELCAIHREESVVLAVSQPFRLPNLLEPLGNRYSKASHNPLLRLSGIDEFRIIHNTSRSSRLPKHSSERANPRLDIGDAGAWE